MITDSEKQNFETMKERTILQQRTKRETYDALKKDELPIPHDLRVEVEGYKYDAYGNPLY